MSRHADASGPGVARVAGILILGRYMASGPIGRWNRFCLVRAREMW